MKINCWQDLEKEIEAFLKERQRRSNLFFHRFYDTRSAGNYLPSQPADFLAIHNGKTFFIEAKFSEVHDSLRATFANAVRAEQTASARLVKRAGGKYVFLFYSKNSQQFEVWDGKYAAEQRSLGRPLELARRKLHTSLENAILGGIFNDTGSGLLRSPSGTQKTG